MGLSIGAGSAAQFADFWLFLLLKTPRSKSRSGGHKHALIVVVHQNGGVALLGEYLYGCALQKVISSLVLGDAPVDPAVQLACSKDIGTGVTSASGHVPAADASANLLGSEVQLETALSPSVHALQFF